MDPDWVRVWLLDMAFAGHDKISVLMAGHNPNISDELHYAIGEYDKSICRKYQN